MYNIRKTLALTLFAVVACTTSHTQSVGDAPLRRVTDLDSQQTTAGGVPDLSLAEHLQRAETYSSNRLFPQARAHWQKVLRISRMIRQFQRRCSASADRTCGSGIIKRQLITYRRSPTSSRQPRTAAKASLCGGKQRPSRKQCRGSKALPKIYLALP